MEGVSPTGPAYRKYDFKTAFLDSLLARLAGAQPHVLDMGSGTSRDFVEVLRRYPGVRYTGVEFRESRLSRARELLAGYPGVELITGFGEDVQRRYADHFDLTLSLSVLEHVKNLREFLRSSVRVTRPGGLVVHRYDLGHALHAGAFERTKVFLCRRVPFVVPARHFTTHPQLAVVVRLLDEAGVEVQGVSHAQMPGHKAVMNRLDWDDPASAELARSVVAMDDRLAAFMQGRADQREMEAHFPVVTVMGVKR